MKQKTFESRYRAALQGAGYAVQDVIDGEDFWVAYATHPSGFEVQVDCWPEEVTSVWGAVPIPPPVWKERGHWPESCVAQSRSATFTLPRMNPIFRHATSDRSRKSFSSAS